MRKASRVILVSGILLVLAGLILILYLGISTDRAVTETADAIAKLRELMPPERIGAPEDFTSMEMPSLELDGRDVIGLLSIPRLGTELPVAARWDKKTVISFPQRFSGSVYDGSLIIGGYDREGQLACLKLLDIGDEISLTDMTGAKFSYTVSKIERKRSAEKEVLSDPSSDLTLFVRDSGNMEYIVVRCAR